MCGSTSSVAAGDFNGDGQTDFAEVCPQSSHMAIVLSAASPSRSISVVPISSPGAVQAVDVNGDGKLDLVTVGIDLEVWLGNGDGTFAAPIKTSLGNTDGASSEAIADFNGDGKLDVAVGVGSGVWI